MASTNKTTHYDLSQYIGSDKPTYLVDYNTDMANIDQGIYDAKSEADTNNTAIGTLSNLETSNKSDLVSAINEVNSESTTNTQNIGNLSNLTTESNTSLVSAINEVDAEADTNNQNIGTMVNLETTVKTSLVGAINEVNSKTNGIGNLSSLQTANKTSVVNAINEVRAEEEGILLWTNNNVTAQFGAQTINVDLSQYKYIEILYISNTSGRDIYSQKLYKSDNTELFKPYYDSGNFYLRTREVEWNSNNRLVVQNGLLNGNTNNSACIPFKLIGFKKDY